MLLQSLVGPKPRRTIHWKHLEITMHIETPSPYLTTREAARYLRLRPSTLERWRSVGGGPSYRKFAGRVVYAREELEAFVEAGRRSSTSDPGLTARGQRPRG